MNVLIIPFSWSLSITLALLVGRRQGISSQLFFNSGKLLKKQFMCFFYPIKSLNNAQMETLMENSIAVDLN